jgi:hypothetical protein
MEQTEWYLFVLAAILIVAVYYVGVKTDIGAFSGLINSAGNVFTGRAAAGGPFGGYPVAGATAA